MHTEKALCHWFKTNSKPSYRMAQKRVNNSGGHIQGQSLNEQGHCNGRVFCTQKLRRRGRGRGRAILQGFCACRSGQRPYAARPIPLNCSTDIEKQADTKDQRQECHMNDNEGLKNTEYQLYTKRKRPKTNQTISTSYQLSNDQYLNKTTPINSNHLLNNRSIVICPNTYNNTPSNISNLENITQLNIDQERGPLPMACSPCLSTTSSPSALSSPILNSSNDESTKEESPQFLKSKPFLMVKDVSFSEVQQIKSSSRYHHWHWDTTYISDQCIVSEDKLKICFHPVSSGTTEAVIGNKPLVQDGNYYYWEVKVPKKIYGTSVMFGICTKDQKLHLDEYRNLIGLDEHGWSLSHKGHLWHNGEFTQYTHMFPINRSVTIGMLFDTMKGELSYFKDGVNLGVAFRGLNRVKCDLYPVVGSTARGTRMRLEGSYCGFMSLFERSCFTLIRNASDRIELMEQLIKDYQLPKNIINYLARSALDCLNHDQIMVDRLLKK